MGILLVNIIGRILARILLSLLNGHRGQGFLSEGQCDYVVTVAPLNMIFAAGHLRWKCQEMMTHFYTTLVDLTKAFDVVNREGP
ncbi:hypothetical protein SprV_0702314500 [Sparganum proliferum]